MNVLLFHGTTEGNYLRQNTEAAVRTLAVSGGLKVQTFAVCLHQKSYDTISAIRRRKGEFFPSVVTLVLLNKLRELSFLSKRNNVSQ